MKTKLEKLKADYNKLGTKQRASKIGQSLKFLIEIEGKVERWEKNTN